MDEVQRARLQPVLAALQQKVAGAHTVVLASADGFALVAAGVAHGGERLAAMTSAMLGLAGALGRELLLGRMQRVMLDAGHGKVLLVALYRAGKDPLLLLVGCDEQTVSGQLLWNARQCGQAILAALHVDGPAGRLPVTEEEVLRGWTE